MADATCIARDVGGGGGGGKSESTYIPTLVRVFLCPFVGPFPSVGRTLTWFIWDRNRALHITLHSVNSV